MGSVFADGVAIRDVLGFVFVDNAGHIVLASCWDTRRRSALGVLLHREYERYHTDTRALLLVLNP